MNDSPTTISDVLKEAARLLEARGNSLRASQTADALVELSKLKLLQEYMLPEEVALNAIPDRRSGPRTGQAFVRRPVWLVQRDLFPLTESDHPADGWSPPSSGDANLMHALTAFLRTLAADDDQDGEDSQKYPAAGGALAPALGRFDPATDAVIAWPRFLPGAALIHVELDDGLGMLDGLFYAVSDGGETPAWTIGSFNYQSPKLFALNGAAGLRLVGNELSYFRYFMHVVRSDDGCFRIIEPHLRKQLAEFITASVPELSASELFGNWQPVALTGLNHDQGLFYRTQLLYGGGIFESSFLLHADGGIEMDAEAVRYDPHPALKE